MAEGTTVARFEFPQIQDNPNGWGPCEVPLQFKDTPYQPFSKDDKLGKVRDPFYHKLYNKICRSRIGPITFTKTKGLPVNIHHKDTLHLILYR